MVDCNEMSIAANPLFSWTCQTLYVTLTYRLYTNILYGKWCKLINANGTFSRFVRPNGTIPNGIRWSGKAHS